MDAEPVADGDTPAALLLDGWATQGGATPGRWGLLALAVLRHFGMSPAALLRAAADHSAFGDDVLRPGVRSEEGFGKQDALRLELTRLLEIAGLPHVLMRLGTVATAREARRSVHLGLPAYTDGHGMPHQ
ncbi:hypothetical protein [Streptomyces sp. NBC_00829]|uniref:hypothetical protein n=1 Tax=Streptomyces sp. NBC_00829 TaxID=2903679 RepID=UPI0038705EC8|nr:hypothetical protein OG293_35710 [Streptomyces sp. NBC_00829]